MNSNKFLVKPGSKVKLADWDPCETHGILKEAAEVELERDRAKLSALQEILYAEGKRALLVVLQGLDASGKDGAIRHVMSGVNPQGCSVTAFKVPSSEEQGHDFLWRVHKVIPQTGRIGVFNRSQYEDVLVARVHKLVPKEVWSGRYAHINHFERLLSDSGVSILKFFLHVSKDEQKKRLEQRFTDRTKLWKVNLGDLEERKRWSAYREAYEDALRECSTEWAPWYIIPADRKWFRNLAVMRIVVETLEAMKLKYPKPRFDPAKIVVE
jgi:PPK2 family polyphosphate:nucleotide phosphotransferase